MPLKHVFQDNRCCVNQQNRYLQTTLKPKYGTALCVFAFKELLRFYIKHGSARHVAFLDASKRFDLVNRHKFYRN